MPIFLGYIAAGVADYFGGSLIIANMAFADPALTESSRRDEPRSAHDEPIGTIRELCAQPYDVRYDHPRTIGNVNGAEWRTFITEDVIPKVLLGPFVGVGHCMVPLLRPGGLVFADPNVPAFSGAVVVVHRPSAPAEIRISVKILQQLLGRWFVATLDENPPLAMIPGDTILGVVTICAHLPPDDPRTLEAERRSLETEAAIPKVGSFIKRLHRPLVMALMEKGSDLPAVPYPFGVALNADRLKMLKDAGIPVLMPDVAAVA